VLGAEVVTAPLWDFAGVLGLELAGTMCFELTGVIGFIDSPLWDSEGAMDAELAELSPTASDFAGASE
jgi:hypothetical protein